jgi:azurin
VLVALSAAPAARAAAGQNAPAPPLLLDQPLRVVEYQLSRLTNDELLRVERRPHEERYRPVYVALLTRGGLPRDVSEEALAALVGMDEASPTRVLIETLGKVHGGADLQVGPHPVPASERLLTLLFAESADELRKHRDVLLAAAASVGGSSSVRQGAYGALMMADGNPTAAWATAADAGHLADVLGSVSHLPAADLRQQLFEPIAALIRTSSDPAIRTEALTAVGWSRADRSAFELLAAEVVSPRPASTDATRGAAVRSLRRIPASAWPADDIEPLARALVAWLRSLPAADRTQPDAMAAIELGRDLAAALGGTRGRALETDLAALEVRVVRIATLPAEMRFDLNWFAVQAGRSVQIVFTNIDAMPHNLVVGRPGAVEALGTAGAAMPMPADPEAKPFVPDSPLVIEATPLLQDGQTARLAFTAPSEPGEYVYVCTFPGHWMRMYGVMLVVPSLDAWKASPTRPTDPLTGQPFELRDGDGGADLQVGPHQ